MSCANQLGLIVSVLLSQFFADAWACEDHATFYLDTTNSGRNLSLTDAHAFHFNKDVPLKVIIHGWSEHASKTHYINMAETLLSNMNCYVIRVDYSTLASGLYVKAAAKAHLAGDYVSDFLVNIMQNYDISMAKVHLIGHSLGAHVAGFVGKRVEKVTGKKLHRITALDPAGPLFQQVVNFGRLTENDAELVDIVHTDSGYLGYKNALGHVDFYPNGGTREQPGCSNEPRSNPFDMVYKYAETFFCSHHRSFIFFTASILHSYSATLCTSWKAFKEGTCDQNKRITFGARMPEDDNDIAGKYFFELPISDATFKKIWAIDGNY